MGRLAAILAVAVAALAVAGAAAGHRTATIRFSFQTYANNVKVVAPLVGPWQLGTARLHGSGRVGDGAFIGTAVDFTDPLYSRYEPASMRAHVVGYSYLGGAHGAFSKLTLTIEIDSATNGGARCDPRGPRALTLYDPKAPLANGRPPASGTRGHWTGARCPPFVQGWTNDDGGPRTSPARGGPPHGGQWAIVHVNST